MRPPRALRTPGRFLPPAADLHSTPCQPLFLPLGRPPTFPCGLSPGAGREAARERQAVAVRGSPEAGNTGPRPPSHPLPERRCRTPSLEGKTPPAAKTGGDQPAVSDLLPRHPSLQHVPGLGLGFPVSPEQGTRGPRSPLHNQLRIPPKPRVPAVTRQGAVAGPLGDRAQHPGTTFPLPGTQPRLGTTPSGVGRGRAPALVPGGGRVPDGDRPAICCGTSARPARSRPAPREPWCVAGSTHDGAGVDVVRAAVAVL